MYQHQIIGQTAGQNFNPYLPPKEQARASGVITEYQFIAIKPKKKLKELKLVLRSEKKKFLFFKYGKKFNLKDRCVVCGFHHLWEQGDYLRRFYVYAIRNASTTNTSRTAWFRI